MDKVQRKKLVPLIMTALIWDINFRLTYKNNDAHMDLGDYASLKFDPLVILIKNILSIVIVLSIYIISKKLNSSKKEHTKLSNTDTNSSKYLYESFFIGPLIEYHKLDTKEKQIIFYIKIILAILFIYIIEEIYFIIGNTHILDRLNVPKRNLGVLITLFIFSSLLIKKEFNFYKHQLIPSSIVIASSIFIIIFEAITVSRFKKLYTFLNFFYYMIVYILMGIEIVLIKYLTYIQFIPPLLILFLKGFIGTIVFTIINIYTNAEKFFYFFDNILVFEYGELYEDFHYVQKMFYIITLLILQYLKINIINEYSESHFLSVAMIADMFFFPLYLIEKFGVQGFPITTSSTFYLNIIFGVMNTFLLLVFNEIIELECWGINKNLNKNIEKRKALEMKKTLKEMTKIENDDDYDSNYKNDFDDNQTQKDEAILY